MRCLAPALSPVRPRHWTPTETVCAQHSRRRLSLGTSFPAPPRRTASCLGGCRLRSEEHCASQTPLNPEHALGRGAPWAFRRIRTVVSGIPAAHTPVLGKLSWRWRFPPFTPGSHGATGHLCDAVLTRLGPCLPNSHLPVGDVLPTPASKPHWRQDWLPASPAAPGSQAHTAGQGAPAPERAAPRALSKFLLNA